MKKFLLFPFSLFVIFFSCSKSKTPEDTKGFPKNVAAIINTQCAVAGCHTDNSSEAAGGLSLSSWTALFQGGYGGEVVIPYRHDQSWLSYFVNTDTSLGIVLQPTMPPAPHGTPLSKEQVILLQQWIDKGAPDEAGEIAFTGDPNRNKFYVVNQSCGEVTVFDTKTLHAMRYIHVSDPINTLPHSVMVSTDMQYWYVIYFIGNLIKKYRTSDDSYVGSINLSDTGSWNTMAFYNYKGDNRAFAVDFNGRLALVDLDNLRLIKLYQESGIPLFPSPHGCAISPNKKTLYVASQTEDKVYKIDLSDSIPPYIQTINVDVGLLQNNTKVLGLHAMQFTPDGSKYFITCQWPNQVLEFLAGNDSLINIFNVGSYPQETAISTTMPYLFVTCQEDANPGYKCKGSVAVINYNTNELLPYKILTGLYQPHGVAVDDKYGYVIVPSLNFEGGGPAPHHQSTCGGNNGFVEVFDLNNLTKDPISRTEVSVYPYFVSVRN